MNQLRLWLASSAEDSLLASSVERDIVIYTLWLWVLSVGGTDRVSAGRLCPFTVKRHFCACEKFMRIRPNKPLINLCDFYLYVLAFNT